MAETLNTRITEDLFVTMKHLYPDNPSVLKDVISGIIARTQKNKELSVVVNNGITKESTEMSTTELLDFIDAEPSILTGQGGIYLNSDKVLPIKNLITSYIESRKIHKKAMFVAKKEGNKEKAEEENLKQLIYKVYANSIYGVMGLRSSIFFCEDSAKAVTFTGVQLITTSITSFERFLGNNIKFNNVYDFIKTVELAFNSEEKNNVDKNFMNNFLDFDYSKEEVLAETYKRFSYKLSDSEKVTLSTYLNQKNTMELNQICLLNRYLELFKHSKFLDLMGKLVNQEYKSYDSMSDEYKDASTKLWEVILFFTVDVSHVYDRYNRSAVMTRSSVTVTDTDSTFCNIQPFYDKLEEVYGVGSKDQFIWNSNIIINVLTKYIDLILRTYCMKVGITNETDIKNINMKSEFLFQRVLTTMAKKRYMALMLAQEGVILAEPDLEMKGINIKKSNVSPEVAKFVKEEIIEKEIMNAPIVDVIKISKMAMNYIKNIEMEIKQGVMDYYPLLKINQTSAYKDPTRMIQYRAGMIYEFLYKDTPLDLPAKFKQIRLTGCTVDALKAVKPDSIDWANRVDNLEAELKRTGLDRFGIDCIAVPYYTETAPEEILSFVNTSIIVDAIYQNAFVEILTPLGIKHVKYDGVSYGSSMVQF